jgi:thiamine pyrophosphate-dependent acetolactate synthase large subunit-like protein
MGAKLAKPDKLCINVWGDAAIGFTGMDFETAVRERIPILSILLNNFSMAIELKVMPVSTEKYCSTDISGDYVAMARAFDGYGERVTNRKTSCLRSSAALRKQRKACRYCWNSSPARKPRCCGRGRDVARSSPHERSDMRVKK